VSGVFTTQLSGATITGNSAGFTSITGVTVTGTTANFTSGVFTTLTGTTAQFGSGVTFVGNINVNSHTIGRDSGGDLRSLAVGQSALQLATSAAAYNTAVGYQTLQNLTTGKLNTALGVETLRAIVNGDENVAVGVLAGSVMVSGSGNTLVGRSALERGTGSNNIVIGNQAGSAITAGDNNTVIGSLESFSVSTTTLTGTVLIGAGSTERLRIDSTGLATVSALTASGTISGVTANFVTHNGASGVFTTRVSGATVTGNTGLFTNITGSTITITTASGATPAIVCSGVVSGGTSGFVIQGPLIILP
jgi:hypothetical protein